MSRGEGHRHSLRTYVFTIALVSLLYLSTACLPTRSPEVSQDSAPSSEAQTPPIPTKAASIASPSPVSPPDLSQLRVSTGGWNTDFFRHSVPLDEFRSGGPPRDGIPPIDHPKLETVVQADAWLDPREPVLSLTVGGESRAYPLQILTWHEIVNDQVGGTPVSVTYCPLCNTAIAFDRRVDGRLLDFGTTGNLRHSDLVMWDRQTESWWQQATGEAIVGELTGQRLEMLAAHLVSWREFRDQFPAARVLSRETGFERDYGRNPYVGYDGSDQTPFLLAGTADSRLAPMERVVAVSLNGEDAAYPFSALLERRVLHDRLGGQPIVLFFQPGTLSALDARRIAESRDIGASGVYRPEVRGRVLTFAWNVDAFVDAETGSRWNVLGYAIEGPLAAAQLPAVVHVNPFWFAWAAFKPNLRLWTPDTASHESPPNR